MPNFPYKLVFSAPFPFSLMGPPHLGWLTYSGLHKRCILLFGPLCFLHPTDGRQLIR